MEHIHIVVLTRTLSSSITVYAFNASLNTSLIASLSVCPLSSLNRRPRSLPVPSVCRRWRELCQLSLRSVRQINLNRYFGPLHVQCRPALTDQRFKLVLQLLPNLQKLELGPAGARLSRNGILSIGKAEATSEEVYT